MVKYEGYCLIRERGLIMNLEEIWVLQGELNKIIGRDTIDNPNTKWWFFDYAIALHDEATELFNCCNWKWWSAEGHDDQYQKIIDPKNAKIEVIDCLHFLISLMHITGFDILKYKKEFEESWNNKPALDEKSFAVVSTNLIYNSVDLMRTGDYIDIEKLLKITMINLIGIFIILGFEKSDILKIYKMKHEKNILRQKNGYSMKNKTEADNDEIKNNI